VRPIPEELTRGPFRRARALDLGVSSRMLDAHRFVRIHPSVYRLRAYEMTDKDLVTAARLALPDRAHLTGISRLQRLGLDYGPRAPVRFVIEGDHHLAIDGIFLHRTKALPPYDDDGVSIEAAFVSYCSLARVIDAIKVGDWLLHNTHMDAGLLKELCTSQLWRAGAYETLWIFDHLTPDSWSLKESELHAVLCFAGLPQAQLNAPVDLSGAGVAVGDLVYRQWRTVVEYEGTHHQADRTQYNDDIDRYALFRDHGHRYVQVTKERLARPRSVVSRVYRELVKAGYDGPPPVFGEQWRLLFTHLSTIIGPRVPSRRDD
jgi:very-short-patch-repair endonuclease